MRGNRFHVLALTTFKATTHDCHSCEVGIMQESSWHSAPAATAHQAHAGQPASYQGGLWSRLNRVPGGGKGHAGACGHSRFQAAIWIRQSVSIPLHASGSRHIKVRIYISKKPFSFARLQAGDQALKSQQQVDIVVIAIQFQVSRTGVKYWNAGRHLTPPLYSTACKPQ